MLQRHAVHLASALVTSPARLEEALLAIQRGLRCGTRLNKRRANPANFQLLLDPELLRWA